MGECRNLRFILAFHHHANPTVRYRILRSGTRPRLPRHVASTSRDYRFHRFIFQPDRAATGGVTR
ncbi:hypothetical protein KCP70_07990 [Salmonella enterica subsp. enterica]|nr:hypothetical protein KCP70_07990 [Salmonella enterica subsp. enterica]